jgi:hypothetical protein
MPVPDGSPTTTPETVMQSMVSIAVETWRVARVFERVLAKTDAGEQARYRSQFRWFVKKVEESLGGSGLHWVSLEGQPFDPGMAATPLNIGEFGGGEALVVDQMIEPIIMGKEGLVRAGTVTLRREGP